MLLAIPAVGLEKALARYMAIALVDHRRLVAEVAFSHVRSHLQKRHKTRPNHPTMTIMSATVMIQTIAFPAKMSPYHFTTAKPPPLFVGNTKIENNKGASPTTKASPLTEPLAGPRKITQYRAAVERQTANSGCCQPRSSQNAIATASASAAENTSFAAIRRTQSVLLRLLFRTRQFLSKFKSIPFSASGCL